MTLTAVVTLSAFATMSGIGVRALWMALGVGARRMIGSQCMIAALLMALAVGGRRTIGPPCMTRRSGALLAFAAILNRRISALITFVVTLGAIDRSTLRIGIAAHRFARHMAITGAALAAVGAVVRARV